MKIKAVFLCYKIFIFLVCFVWKNWLTKNMHVIWFCQKMIIMNLKDIVYGKNYFVERVKRNWRKTRLSFLFV